MHIAKEHLDLLNRTVNNTCFLFPFSSVARRLKSASWPCCFYFIFIFFKWMLFLFFALVQHTNVQHFFLFFAHVSWNTLYMRMLQWNGKEAVQGSGGTSKQQRCSHEAHFTLALSHQASPPCSTLPWQVSSVESEVCWKVRLYVIRSHWKRFKKMGAYCDVDARSVLYVLFSIRKRI